MKLSDYCILDKIGAAGNSYGSGQFWFTGTGGRVLPVVPGEFAEEVNVVAKAASRKPVTRMNTLRIGNAFEVKVLNIEARMEQGKDDGGRYWKLYW